MTHKLSTFLFLVLSSPLALAQSNNNCANMIDASDPGADLQITSAEYFQEKTIRAGGFGPELSLPPHCHIEGEIDRRTGSDGKSYALRFAINMPEGNWNGRFLFQGGGGLNGTLGEPVGAAAAGDSNALSRGFAVVSTDSGHEGAVFDGSFLADQEAALNFYFLGNMRVTLAAKPLVEQYYSENIEASYFVGCSTGGREGMIMAQRFPLLYDGIVSGAPAIRTGLSNLGLRWYNMQLNQAADKGNDGFPLPGGTFNTTEQKFIIDQLLLACDSLDGAEDGLIFNTQNCQFDPRTLSCPAGQSDNCISPEKAEALVRAIAGPVNSQGVQLYSPFVLDAGNDDSIGFQAGLLAGGAVPPEGGPVDKLMTMDVDAEFLIAMAGDLALGNSTSYNLNTFAANGGKQIFYHGVSDPWFSAMDTLHYYDNLVAANGGLETVDSFSRVFLAPGMGHCQGGEQTLDSFDMLTAIVDWVENNEAPSSIVATGNSMPGVSRPLCPHPQHAQYQGNGDINMAENFQCQE